MTESGRCGAIMGSTMSGELRSAFRWHRTSAYGELVLGLALMACAGLVLFVMDHWSRHGVGAQFHDLFVLLQHYRLKWCVVAVSLIAGFGLCQSALGRLRLARQYEIYSQGPPLESSRWLNRPAPEHPASAAASDAPTWDMDRLP